MKDVTTKLVSTMGRRYSEILDIDVDSGREEELFKWLIASALFSARIRESVAVRTYRELEEEGYLTPMSISDAKWEDLVSVLDRGGYTRYDFKTADKLQQLSRNLLSDYGGRLGNLYMVSADQRQLEERIKDLAKGIGDVTVSIFLREVLLVWNVDPRPTKTVLEAARRLRLGSLQKYMLDREFYIRLETALLRLGRDFCAKSRCTSCGFRSACPAQERASAVRGVKATP